MSGGSEARTQVMGGIRAALNRTGDEAAARETVRRRLAEHPRGLVPARAQIPHAEQVSLFVTMATEVAATVATVPSLAAVPGAVAAYLAERNLAAAVRVAPDARLKDIPWSERPTLEVSFGRARDADGAALTGAFAGIAETGTLMFVSGPDHPTTLNFLPDTHIVVLDREQIAGAYEEAWDRLRAAGNGLPRTVNFVTGPSRTGDIEQKIELGAHGPRRLHILLVDPTGASAV